MMMTLKGLPLAYNKDTRKTKKGLNRCARYLTTACMAALVLDGIQVKRPRCPGRRNGVCQRHGAGGLLVAKGVPRNTILCWRSGGESWLRRGKRWKVALADLQKFSRVIEATMCIDIVFAVVSG